jgi:hypothetical protein
LAVIQLLAFLAITGLITLACAKMAQLLKVLFLKLGVDEDKSAGWSAALALLLVAAVLDAGLRLLGL